MTFSKPSETSRELHLRLNVWSTYYSDPRATHVVETASEQHGYGIYGYYTSEFDAYRVAKAVCGKVVLHNPAAAVLPGIHPLVDAHIKGYI